MWSSLRLWWRRIRRDCWKCCRDTHRVEYVTDAFGDDNNGGDDDLNVDLDDEDDGGPPMTAADILVEHPHS